MDIKTLSAELHTRGIRPTQQRLAVLSYLRAHPIHPTADDIYTALLPTHPALSKTTVYNALNALVAAGAAREVTIDPHEQRFDGNPDDHGHFRCTSCGKLYDFPCPTALLQTAVPPGFRADIRDLYLSGLCPECQP